MIKISQNFLWWFQGIGGKIFRNLEISAQSYFLFFILLLAIDELSEKYWHNLLFRRITLLLRLNSSCEIKLHRPLEFCETCFDILFISSWFFFVYCDQRYRVNVLGLKHFIVCSTYKFCIQAIEFREWFGIISNTWIIDQKHK